MTEPAPLPIATPPGWYPEPQTGRQRWWDGIQWAFYPADGEQVSAGVALGAATPTPTKPYAGVAYPTTYQHPTNGMATASLVFGLVGVVLCFTFIPSILAVVFGLIGIGRANERGGVGGARALWGVVLGGLVLFMIIIVLSSN